MRAVGEKPHQRIVDGIPDGIDNHGDTHGPGIEAQRVDVEKAEPGADDGTEKTGGKIASAVQNFPPQGEPLIGIGLEKFHDDLLLCRLNRQIEAVQL